MKNNFSKLVDRFFPDKTLAERSISGEKNLFNRSVSGPNGSAEARSDVSGDASARLSTRGLSAEAGGRAEISAGARREGRRGSVSSDGRAYAEGRVSG